MLLQGIGVEIGITHFYHDTRGEFVTSTQLKSQILGHGC